MDLLTLHEQILLLSIWRLGEDAYGVSIRDQVIQLTKKNIVYGTLYNSLDKLVKKGFVMTRRGEPTPERGGRRKIYYTLTREGMAALQKAKELQSDLWGGVPDLV